MTDKPTVDDAADRLESEILDAWTVDGPSDDLVDRALAARRHAPQRPTVAAAPSRRSRFRARHGFALVAVAVGAAALFVAFSRGRTPRSSAVSGELAVEERRSVRLGHRGVAVVEPKAHLRFSVATDGAARVEQDRGEIFYRVDRGGAFVVRAPGAQIEVTGTCFRVEVTSMRFPKSAAVGALVGAVVVVTVFEGKVLLSDDSGSTTEVVAGETEVVSNGEFGGHATAAAGSRKPDRGAAASWQRLEEPPPADISRAALLERDQALRTELLALKSELEGVWRQLAHARRKARERDEDGGRPWFDPSPEQLARYAEECRVLYDTPPLHRTEPGSITPAMAAKYGMTESERAAVNALYAEVHAEVLAFLRELYAEVTGTAHGSELLSPDALASELIDKSPTGEVDRIQQQLAGERAGILKPPTDPSHVSPLERYYRMLAAIGDQMEQRLATVVGTERARALREVGEGWGTRHVYAGCPEDSRAGN